MARAVSLAQAKRGPKELDALPDPEALGDHDSRDHALLDWTDEGKHAAVVDQAAARTSRWVGLGGVGLEREHAADVVEQPRGTDEPGGHRR